MKIHTVVLFDRSYKSPDYSHVLIVTEDLDKAKRIADLDIFGDEMATRIFSSELEKEDDILLDFRDDMEHQE